MTSQVHRLFFALRPDATVLAAIGHALERLKTTQCIGARWLEPAKLHLTVQFLGDFIATDDIVARARCAAATLRVAPFEFTLDRVVTFPRRFNPPCVLRCDAESESPVQELSRELAAALCAAGLVEYIEARPYVPHVTIAYAQSALAEPIAIEPIGWRAHAIGLVESHDGRHAQIGSWPLRA